MKWRPLWRKLETTIEFVLARRTVAHILHSECATVCNSHGKYKLDIKLSVILSIIYYKNFGMRKMTHSIWSKQKTKQ